MTQKKFLHNHIETYLNYYFSLDVAPNYAIMLRGKWGSGKSWLIKDYRKRHDEYKYLYVSLYGITNYKDIQESFYSQIHPVLSSKSMKLFGKVAKGFLKGALKLDLNDDHTDDGTLSIGLPDGIEPSEYLKSLEKRILIFDDLERCSIPIYNILGYINQFVETDDFKVVIIANEEEIIKLDNTTTDETKKYLIIKEKLIGKSFDVTADIDGSIDSFIDLIKDEKVKRFFNQKSNLIKEIFLSAGYNNLRHVRQSMLDFVKFYSFLSIEAKKKDDLMEHIMRIFFAISFELKAGHITENEISSLFYRRSHNKEAKEYQAILDKYSIFHLRSVPAEKVWEDFFKTGMVDLIEINESIKNSSFFIKENTPDWIKLWNFYHLTDDEFNLIYAKVHNDLQNKNIDDMYQLLHIVGMFLSFHERKFISEPKEDIIELGIKNVDRLKQAGKLKLDRGHEFPSDSSHGLSYQGSNIDEYITFLQYINQQIESVQADDYTEEARIVLEKLEISLSDFEKLFWSNNYVYNFQTKPILKYIPVNKFIDATYTLSNWDKKVLGWFFTKRYITDRDTYNNIKEELSWLKELYHEIDIINKQEVKPITKFTVDGLLKTINDVISFIEK